MIKWIRVKDFKSIQDVQLHLDPVTVLVGRSGTGKSNLVKALRFLRNALIEQGHALQIESGWEHLAPAGKPTPQTTIEVGFNIPGEDKDYMYLLGYGLPGTPGAQQQYGLNQMTLREERLNLGDTTLFWRKRAAKGTWAWEKLPIGIQIPHPNDNPVIGSFPSSQEIVYANAALSTGIGYYHLPSATLAQNQQQPPGNAIAQKLTGLNDFADNHRDVLRAITQDFRHPDVRKGLLTSLQQVNPGVLSVELDSLHTPKNTVVTHKSDGGNFSLQLEQESDGFRRFYAHLLALYQTPPKLTLIFEEPENAIFPGALALLADEFKAAHKEGRGQVILTTHNPVLLDSFEVENVRVVEMREGRTIAGPVSNTQRQAVKDHLLTTGDLLTVDRARIQDPTPT